MSHPFISGIYVVKRFITDRITLSSPVWSIKSLCIIPSRNIQYDYYLILTHPPLLLEDSGVTTSEFPIYFNVCDVDKFMIDTIVLSSTSWSIGCPSWGIQYDIYMSIGYNLSSLKDSRVTSGEVSNKFYCK